MIRPIIVVAPDAWYSKLIAVMIKETFPAHDLRWIMCSIVVWDLKDNILVCEEN